MSRRNIKILPITFNSLESAEAFRLTLLQGGKFSEVKLYAKDKTWVVEGSTGSEADLVSIQTGTVPRKGYIPKYGKGNGISRESKHNNVWAGHRGKV